jgi:nucleoside-diphosphate-sugar epimerase
MKTKDNKNVGAHWIDSTNFTFVKGDLLSFVDLGKLKIEHYSLIFHLAATPKSD